MMKSENLFKKSAQTTADLALTMHRPAHPAWRLFIEYCTQLDHGEISTLKIKDGLPVLAEVTTKKVKFVP